MIESRKEAYNFLKFLTILLWVIIAFFLISSLALGYKRSMDEQFYQVEFNNLKKEELLIKILDKQIAFNSFKSGKHYYRTEGYYLVYTEKETFKLLEGEREDTIYANLDVGKSYKVLVRQLDVGSKYRTILEIIER